MFFITLSASFAVLAVFYFISAIGKQKSTATAVLNLVLILITAAVTAWIFWLARPAVGFRYPALWLWALSMTAVGPFFAGRRINIFYFLPLTAVALAAVVMLFAGGKIIRSKDYYSLMNNKITDTESLDFNADVEPVDLSKLRLVDQQLAGQRGSTLIESISGLGSQVELGRMSIQNLNGSFDIVTGEGETRTLSFDNELVWVGVLHPSGAFKEKTTPGYIIVSSQDASRAFFVTALNGKKLEINYSTGHYFGNNLQRYLRANGYMMKGITDYTFELKNDGRPFYIVTLYDKTIGWNGPEASGIVAVDVQTGEITEYSIDEAPAFIDRIQPELFINRQLNYWGAFTHGWLNSWIKQKDVLKKTEGTSLVYSGGEAYFYSGMQSAGSDRGTTGFVLVNTRTKDTRFYRISGITEDRAGEALENAKGVKEAGYSATPAILYNIGSRPVYFCTLKGADGLVKMYGFISLKNEQILGVGTTVREALRAFETALINSSDSLSIDSSVSETIMETVVSDITSETISGMTYYYILFQDYPETEFLGSSDTFRELKWTKPGDMVRITFPEGEQKTVSLRDFDNLRLGLQ